MQITPIEIRQKRFEKKLRGYNTDEVDGFLHSLAHNWEKLLTQYNELKVALETYKKDIERLQNIENALLQTMRDGETTATHLVEQAKRESELLLKEASLSADQLISDAKAKAQDITEKSKEEAKQRQLTIEKELGATQTSLQETVHYREAILKQLNRLGKELVEKSQTTLENLTQT
jgi:cell division initiation protein